MLASSGASASMSSLARLGRKHYVSQSGLEAILKELQRNPDAVEASSSRRSIKRARDKDVDVDTPYGNLLTDISVTLKVSKPKEKDRFEQKKLPMLNMKAFLWHICRNIPQMAAFFQRRMALFPMSPEAPWGMCLYTDEISPGNVLRPLNTRKVHAFYLTFSQLGPQARCQEHLWFTVCLARSSLVNKMVGGLSALTHCLVTALADLSHGCMLTMGDSGERSMLFAAMETMLGDESALKFVFDVKGASGTLPCSLCSNIVSRLSDLEAHDATNTLRPIHETDTSKFKLRSNENVWCAHDLLASKEPEISKGDFSRLEQSLGLNYNPHGVIANRSLPLASMLMYDWMHVYLVTGLFHAELGLLLPRLYLAGFSAESIYEWLQGFHWPHNLKGRRSETMQCFQKRISPGEFKASASQSLSAYGLLRLFVLTVFREDMDLPLKAALRCFLKLCAVLDFLLEGNRGQEIDHVQLSSRISQHCQMFLRVYGVDSIIPNFISPYTWG